MAVPLHFTIEFLGFLVTAGGALLVVLRPDLIAGEPSNRLTVAFGLGVLAAAQTAHGASFLETDGDRVLLAMHTLGFAFIFFGVAGSARGSVAGATFAFREPLALVPAVAAILAAGASFLASSRGSPKTLRRLSAGLVALAVSDVLVTAAPRAEFGSGLPIPFTYASHGAKLVGFLFLSSWLWTGVRSSIRTRFVASFTALLVAVVLALSTALTGVISNNVENAEKARVRAQLESAIDQLEVEEVRELNHEAELIEGLVRDQVADRTGLDGLARRIINLEVFSIDFVIFLEPPPKPGLLAVAGTGPHLNKTKKPKPLSDFDALSIAGSEVVQEVEGGATGGSSLDRVGGDAIAAVAARKIEHPQFPGRVVGILVTGRFLDALTTERLSDQQLQLASIVLRGNVIASELEGRPSAAKLVPKSVRERVAGDDEGTVLLQSYRGDSYYSAFGTLRSEAEDPLGTLVLSSPSSIVVQAREGITRTLFLVAMGVGAVVLILAWLSGRRITRPIQVLTAAARSVREGDLSAQAQVGGDDEVGQLGETFNEMTGSLMRMTGDLREAAREEQRLRSRIETIIQSMADGLVAVDVDRKILAFNREAEYLTGIKANRALTKTVDKVLDARDQQGQKVTLPIYDLSEGSVSGVFLARRNGDLVPVAVTSAVLRNEDDEPAGAVAVIRDMTREREIERMKNEFLSNISHELRTPLTPIKGYAEILHRKEVPRGKQLQFVGGILEGTTKLERIVQLLVDFAAMEAGRLSPKSAAIDVAPIVRQVAEEWGPRAARHNIVADVDGGLSKVLGDEGLIKRSLDEVMDNAVKFSPEGGTITLSARNGSSGNGRGRPGTVEISISDEGIGIPADDVERIFSDFHQLDGSETRTYGGLGLGLAFVDRIVDEHNGQVWAESEPERGTTITIALPAVRSGRAAARNN